MFDALTAPTFGALCALASALLWAVTSLLVRRLAAVCSMVTINAVRVTAGGALLVVVSLAGDGRAEFMAMSAMAFVLVAASIVIAAGIGDTIFFETTRLLGLGRAMTLSMAYPLLAAVLAAAFLGETLTLRSMLGAIVTLAGLILIVSGREEGGVTPRRWWLGVLGALATALTWAVSTVMLKPALQEMSPLTAQAIRLPIVAGFLWLTPWARGGVPALWAAGAGVAFPLTLLCALTVVSSLTFVASVKYADVVVATVLSSTAPMFAIALGAAFLGERVTAAAVVGALLTIAGIVVLKV